MNEDTSGLQRPTKPKEASGRTEPESSSQLVPLLWVVLPVALLIAYGVFAN